MTDSVVVRISRGDFDPDQLHNVTEALNTWRERLEPALLSLQGLKHYYVAVDPVTSSMTNVSVWESLAHAQQMASLAVMLEQRAVFEALGVRFDPIRNFTTLWAVDP
jgi:hypothetical protein